MSRSSEALWNVSFFTVRVPRDGGSDARVLAVLDANAAQAEKFATIGEIRRASATLKLGRSLIRFITRGLKNRERWFRD